jgi:UDP-glucose 4-epimerase
MNILVTGGAGMIGTKLVRMLVASGEHVMVVDNGAHSVSPPALPSGVTITNADVRDREAIAVAIDGMDAVIHLAACGSVVQSIQYPVLNFEVNVQGTLNVIQQSVDARVKKFIFASTGEALLGDAEPPVSEASLPRPISPHGASKLCGEAYCHAFAGSYGLPTVSLRFANVYGPYSAHKRGATTEFIKALMSDSPIIVYGNGMASRLPLRG